MEEAKLCEGKYLEVDLHLKVQWACDGHRMF